MSHTDTEIARICHWLMKRDLIACVTRQGELAITYRDPKRPRHPHVRPSPCAAPAKAAAQ